MKTVDFSETIATCDLKVCRCRQQIELMKICEYLRSMSLLIWANDYLLMKTKACFSQKPLGHFQTKFVCKLLATMK